MPVRESVGEFDGVTLIFHSQRQVCALEENTCRRRIPMIVGLCVDHQAEAVAVPTCAVRPFDYLGAGSSQGVEVNLSENVAYHVHDDSDLFHLKDR